MKSLITALTLVAALGACTPQQQNTAAGAAAGAALGVAISKDEDNVQGAVLGGLAGAAAGNYLGRTQSGQCVYQYPDGTRYTAACP